MLNVDSQLFSLYRNALPLSVHGLLYQYVRHQQPQQALSIVLKEPFAVQLVHYFHAAVSAIHDNRCHRRQTKQNSAKRLFYSYLFNTTLMACTFKRCLEIFVHDSLSHLVVNETSRHYEHVCIVVLTDEMCNLRTPCQT